MAASGGVASASSGVPNDPSSGGGGSITLSSSAKKVGKHGHYTITIGGQLPAGGYVFLYWTSAKKVKTAACPPLATERSFLSAGFGGELLQDTVPAGPISEMKADLRGRAGLEYHYCAYALFLGQGGEWEIAAGTIVKVK